MSARRPVPVISVVGRSGVGKTTVLVPIIAEIKRRGYRLGVVKHHVHDFEIDQPGKDSWRHAQAGADAVALSAPNKMALSRKLDQELPLDEIVNMMGEVDLVITEGYKHGDRPKIEVSRREHSTELVSRPEELIALMTDHPVGWAVPQFALDDAAGVVDLLEELLFGRQEAPPVEEGGPPSGGPDR